MEKKKGLHGKVILWLAVLVCGIAAVAGLSTGVQQGEEQVTITPEVFYGDPSLVEGMEVQTRLQYSGTIQWTTDFVLGQEENAQTTVEHLNGYGSEAQNDVARLALEQDFRVRTMLDGYSIDVERDRTLIYGDRFSPQADWLSTRFNAILEDVQQQCKPGGSTVKTVWLEEYFDYYPLLVNLPTLNMYPAIWQDGQAYMPKSSQEWAYLVSQKLQGYFRIPVVKDDRVTVLLEKDGLGNLSSITFNAWANAPVGGGHCSEVTEAGIYFTMKMPADQYDYSLVPGGYGLYFIPTIVKDDVLCLKLDELATVMSLEADQSVGSLWSSDDGKTLIMKRQVGETGIVFDIVDTASRQVIQTIGCGETPEWDAYAEDIYRVNKLMLRDDYMVIELPDSTLLVYEQQTDGTYRFCFDTDPDQYWSMLHEWNDDVYVFWYDAVGIDFNGEYLAVSYFMRGEDGFHSCDIYVAVFGEEGLAYYGVYRNSLSVGNEMDEYGSRIGGAVDPITLHWPE